MPQRHREAYPPEFKTKLIALVLAGRSPEELASEFEPTGQAIRNWVRQAQLNNGGRRDGLTSDEHAEMARLRKRVKQLELIIEKVERNGARARVAAGRLRKPEDFSGYRSYALLLLRTPYRRWRNDACRSRHP